MWSWCSFLLLWLVILTVRNIYFLFALHHPCSLWVLRLLIYVNKYVNKNITTLLKKHKNRKKSIVNFLQKALYCSCRKPCPCLQVDFRQNTCLKSIPLQCGLRFKSPIIAEKQKGVGSLYLSESLLCLPGITVSSFLIRTQQQQQKAKENRSWLTDLCVTF